MPQSILNSIKKVVGLTPDDSSFDDDLILHINSVFSTLNQLGIGPDIGFYIEDDGPTWEDFLGVDPRYNFVKTYVYLRTRLVFDPPGTSFVIESMNHTIQELEFRMSVLREGEKWIDPSLPVV